MLRAKIYFDLDCDCILSELTGEWNRPFTVSREKIHDDMITLVVDAGEHRATFEERLADSSQVETVKALDESRLLVTKRSCGALPIIRSNHGMLQGMDKVNGSQRVFDIVVLRREDLKAIVAELRELGSVRLGKLTPYEDRTTTLSSRQSEVVEAALDAGYFDWPRRTDAAELAAEFDIAHSTLLEHLRKAEKKLIEDALSRGGTSDRSTPKERAFMLGEAT